VALRQGGYEEFGPGMDCDWNGLERHSGKDMGDHTGIPVKTWKIFDYFILCFTLRLFAVNFTVVCTSEARFSA